MTTHRIDNTLKDVLDSNVIKLLEASEVEFHLHGSRYFIQYRGSELDVTHTDLAKFVEGSDVDFCVQYSPSIHRQLTELGFTQTLFNPDYLGTNTESGWSLVDNTGKLFQVSVKLDLKMYLRVTYIISPEFYVKYLWKSNPHQSIQMTQVNEIIEALGTVYYLQYRYDQLE